MSPAGELADLDAGSAAVVVGWVRSAEELALVAGTTLQWPLTVDQLLASGYGPARRLRVLLDNGVPVALGSARQHRNGVRLGWIVVDPARRGEGWGRTLMTRLIADTRQHYGAVPLTLGVFAHNKPAVWLYRSLGFREQPPTPSEVVGYHWYKIEMELPPPADQP